MERKKQWIWAAAGGCALLLTALVAILVALRLQPEVQPLETLEQHFRPREEAFASMGMPGYLMTEPEEIAAYFAMLGTEGSAEAVLTTSNDALTGIQTGSVEEAKALVGALAGQTDCSDIRTRANLVFFSCASGYAGLALDRLERTDTGWYLLGRRGWTLVKYLGTEQAVLPESLFGEPVSVLGWRSFAGSAVEEVRIPGGVTEIADYAFFTCTALRRLEISEGSRFTRVGEEAFGYCTGLTSIALPAVRWVERFAFRENTALEQVSFSGPVDYLGEGAFYSCNALASITISGGYVFEEGVLYDAKKSVLLFYPQTAKAAEFTLPESVRRVGYGAFCDNMTLTRIAAPGLAEIGPEAFHSCGKLTEVTGMGRVWAIGYRAFFGCGRLEKADFPEKVIRRGEEAFYGCNKLAAVPEGAA